MMQARTFPLFCLLSAGPLAGQSFEVASVKPSPPDSHTETRRWPGGRFTASGVTLRALIQRAYEVQDFQIVGGPKWMDNDRFEIEAKPAVGWSGDLHLLIQSFLAERFHLAIHRENRELRRYVLSVAKGGIRLNPNTSGSQTWSLGVGTLRGEKIPMEMLATDLLQKVLHQPVVNQTGVSGNFDLKLAWTPDETTPADIGSQPNFSEFGPSFFTAIREQLGLQLTPGKGPVEVLIVDSVERPSEN